jgi:molybdate transport system ATP-binding protein
MIALRLELPLPEFVLECALELGGGCTGLFGPSGSGKTSVLESLAGWRRPRAGRIRLGGELLFDSGARIDLPPERRRLGYVPQDVLLLPHWSVRGNLEAAGALEPRVLETFELGPLLERGVRSLSGGERSRVALARALLARPRLLLLDEPLTGLDRDRRRRALALLLAVKERFGIPMLFVSHDATDVQVLCDEVVVLERGQVRAQGPPATVLAAQPGAGFENVLRGRIAASSEGSAALELGPGLRIEVADPGLEAGTAAVFALRGEDVLVARGALPRISARNRLAARVHAVREDGGEIWVEADCGPVHLGARVTRAALRELELAPGVAVTLLFKATSCRLVAA